MNKEEIRKAALEKIEKLEKLMDDVAAHEGVIEVRTTDKSHIGIDTVFTTRDSEYMIELMSNRCWNIWNVLRIEDRIIIFIYGDKDN